MQRRHKTIAHSKTKLTQQERAKTDLRQSIYGLNSVAGS